MITPVIMASDLCITRVVNGENTFMLSEGQSKYIPLSIVRALENSGKCILKLLRLSLCHNLGKTILLDLKIVMILLKDEVDYEQ